MRRGAIIALAMAALFMAGCGGPAEPVWATKTAVDEARYSHPGASSVTLFTVINTSTGRGAHGAMMISGSERVIFDPAGSFRLPMVPERNDLHYGITDTVLSVYIDYHARETYDVRVQAIEVSREEADAIIAAASAYGAVPKAQCTLAVTRILSRFPRFREMRVTYFPMAASEDFAALPGSTMRQIADDDADDNHGVLIAARAELQRRGLTATPLDVEAR